VTGGDLVRNPPRAWPKAIIFDLDGTLVDSAPDIALALNEALATFGETRAIKPFDEKAVMAMIGGGSILLIKRALAAAQRTLSEADEEALRARFMTSYYAVSAEGRGLYPGARQLLSDLRTDGHLLAICTNKPDAVTQVALKALRIAEYFTSVVAARVGRPNKPNPAMLLAALEALNADPADAVMVGDSGTDVGAARAAGMRIVLMSYGYTSIPAINLGSDAVIGQLSDVPAVLDALWSGLHPDAATAT
jgi:phosphoglycolate phosphatase